MSIRSLVGDRKFYRFVLSISVPIMIQNGITNFVGLLDNIMVGRLSTEAMSGVSIVNQFLFIFTSVVFGAVSAAGIFTAQYHGRGDVAGVRATFRFKMLISFFAGVLGIAVFLLFGDAFIGMFLHDGSLEGDLAQTLAEGHVYLTIMLVGLIPAAVTQAYASTLRETEETFLPMAASIAAVLLNFVLNWILIFGHLGLSPMGVRGAAIATVVSRFAEAGILIVWTARHAERCPFHRGAFRSLSIPGALARRIFIRGLPLMANELFWATAITLRNQCYSTRGLDVVAAQNIASTITNLFSIVFISLGAAVAIIVGNLLGAGKLEEARDTDRKLIAFGIFCGVVTGALLAASAPFFPLLYNTSASARSLASYMILVFAAMLPFNAVSTASYFTLRSGGRVLLTMLFDSGTVWALMLPLTFVLTRFTPLSIHWIFWITQGMEIVKASIGYLMAKSGIWVRRLVGESAAE